MHPLLLTVAARKKVSEALHFADSDMDRAIQILRMWLRESWTRESPDSQVLALALFRLVEERAFLFAGAVDAPVPEPFRRRPSRESGDSRQVQEREQVMGLQSVVDAEKRAAEKRQRALDRALVAGRCDVSTVSARAPEMELVQDHARVLRRVWKRACPEGLRVDAATLRVLGLVMQGPQFEQHSHPPKVRQEVLRGEHHVEMLQRVHAERTDQMLRVWALQRVCDQENARSRAARAGV